jgi:hypothetical protein
MKITIHWDRTIGLILTIIVLIIAIQYLKYFRQFNYDTSEDIGQCNMNEAQNIIDNLVG